MRGQRFGYTSITTEQKAEIAILVKEGRKQFQLSRRELAAYLGYGSGVSIVHLEEGRYKFLTPERLEAIISTFSDLRETF